MHWKIARDPHYRSLFVRYGEALVREAGFFEDTATTDAPLDDISTLCTPTTRLTERLATATAPPAVLLCTGSFSPVHAGHLAMMEAARRAVVQVGFDVVGGYLSPGHDEYISLKLGDAALSASRRLAVCGAAVAQSDWLMVDPWEALHCAVAVNFTDVLTRLTAYLHHHVRPDLTVFYVCGADNARFALTFALRGHCVVVDRPGSRTKASHYRAHPLLQDPQRFVWAEADHDGSSTRAREGDVSILPPAVWKALRLRRPDRLSLRLEDARVAWSRAAAFSRFQDDLQTVLSEYFSVHPAPLSAQAIPPTMLPVVSLDPLLPAERNIAISRCFDLGGTTERGHVPRPGSPALAAQCAAIPAGAYALFDDDSVTGGTARAVTTALSPRVRIAESCHLGRSGKGAERQEIADSRDFLLGSRQGGLVVVLPDGSHARAPYVLPYVDPGARCSIPATDIHGFSRRIWSLNAAFFAGSGLTVADLPSPAQRLIRCAGFALDARLEEVCRWHGARILDGFGAQ